MVTKIYLKHRFLLLSLIDKLSISNITNNYLCIKAYQRICDAFRGSLTEHLQRLHISNNIMLRQTPKGIQGIFIGHHGKNVKKHLVVFMLDKAHGLGFYQNTGHTLSSCALGSLILVKRQSLGSTLHNNGFLCNQ